MRHLPVEVVVRGRLSGSTSTALWTQYDAGARTIYGLDFPDGMQKNDPLPEAIITPTTKAEQGGHDEPITELEIVERGIVDAELWDQARTVALAIFERGQQIAAEAGLVLVDTKYEFGLDADGMLTIIDEVHTPDSSVTGGRPRSRSVERQETSRRTSTRNTFGSPTCATATTRSPNLAAAGAPGWKPPGVYQETYAALTRRAFEPRDIPPPSGSRRRCSPTTAEPTIFCFYRPRETQRARTCRLETGFQGRNGFRAGRCACRRDHGQRLRLGDDVAAADILEQFGVPFEAKVVSAHRTPDWMVEYAETAEQRGIEIIIAGAGGAAHLPGMVAGTRSSR